MELSDMGGPLEGVGGDQIKSSLMEKASETNNFHHNKNLKDFARNLRNHPTNAEKRLWFGLLKNKQLLGFRFLRQRPILNYIADFMCKELMLVIEVDGYTHQFEEVFEKDRKKEAALKEVGLRVLGFNDEMILEDFENVRIYLEQWIQSNSVTS
jgi:very-short-patch-repair endonuclease